MLAGGALRWYSQLRPWSTCWQPERYQTRVTTDDLRAVGDLVPRPDPTALTTAQLLRELASLREVLTARLDAMDQATRLLAETVNRTPTVVQTAISHLKELHEERFRSTEQVSQTRLNGIEQQFAERDVRTEQASIATDSALKAALQAAKEAVFENSQAAAKAAEKVELSFTKQIDQIGLRIDTIVKGYDDRLTEIKERIDRGEGAGAGAAGQRTEARLSVSTVIAVILAVVSVATLLLYAAKK
jgi:hypothetical protein